MTAKAKAIGAAVRVAKGDLFPAWAEVLEVLAPLRNDEERAPRVESGRLVQVRRVREPRSRLGALT